MGNSAKTTAVLAVLSAVGMAWAVPASAHPATACIQQAVAAAAKVGVETDVDEESVLAFDASPEPLRPLMAQLAACLARVLPEQTDRSESDGGPLQHYWYRTATREWCRSTNAIGAMGGTTDKKNFPSFFLECGAPGHQ